MSNYENVTFKAGFDKKGNYAMSLIIDGKSYIVTEFYILKKTYVFIMDQYNSFTINRSVIKGQYINDDNINILSLPIAMLKQFRCMK